MQVPEKATAEQIQALQHYVSEQLAAYFGRRPHQCHVYIQSPYIVIVLEDFLSILENTLIQMRENKLVGRMRSLIMDNWVPELTEKIRSETGLHMQHWHYNWNYSTRKGILVAHEQLDHRVDAVEEIPYTYVQDVLNVSKVIHRQPDHVQFQMIDPQLFLLTCTGVLYDIEKRLISNGHERLLRERENIRKVSFFNRLKKKIYDPTTVTEDIFLIWDYQHDLFMICFLFDPRDVGKLR